MQNRCRVQLTNTCILHTTHLLVPCVTESVYWLIKNYLHKASLLMHTNWLAICNCIPINWYAHTCINVSVELLLDQYMNDASLICDHHIVVHMMHIYYIPKVVHITVDVYFNRLDRHRALYSAFNEWPIICWNNFNQVHYSMSNTHLNCKNLVFEKNDCNENHRDDTGPARFEQPPVNRGGNL